MVALKLFLAFLTVLFLSEQGFAQPCSLSAITIHVTKTGSVAYGLPERKVVISNNCICTQSQIVIRCDGFDSVKPLSTAVLKKDEKGGCLVNNGLPIFEGHPLEFKFVGKEPTNLTPRSSQINCS